MLGRKEIVDFSVLTDLSVALATRDGSPSLTCKGSLMESARVFHALKVSRKGNVIFIRILASLPFWKKGGSPDFSETRAMGLEPGVYEIYYRGPGNKKTFFTRVKSEG